MRRAFLKWLYLTNSNAFHELLVEDLIGQIPKDVREPSVAFLGKGRDILTRYLMYQAYVIQRRSVSDLENTQSFHGMLVFIKFLMSLVGDAQPAKTLDGTPFVEEKKPDETEGLAAFASGMKTRRLSTNP